MFPIIIPINHTPDTCPSCHKPEQKKEVCAHCQYEYKDEPLGMAFHLVYWSVAFISFFVILKLISLDACAYQCDGFDYVIVGMFAFVGALLWPIAALIGLLATIASVVI